MPPDRDNPDMELQLGVEMLFRLWDDIRWVFRMLPKPVVVNRVNMQWVTNPPTENIVPRLISRAAMQPIPASQCVMIMNGLTAWSDAFTKLLAIAALEQDDRPVEMYADATAALYECADELAQAVVAVRQHQQGRRHRHGKGPAG